MRFLSLFSGIEACTVAWKPLGWECVAFAEIEPFPCSLLAHHYPDIPNLGDVTKITENQIKALGQIDLVVFGSPCQNLSTAGNRKGLDGQSSGLFYDAIRIIQWARKHNNCRFALWENVPGAFSSNKGADFTAVVREMAGLEDVETPEYGWGNTGAALGTQGLLEWRVLDAQYFGLAQRRKRVFAVLDTGDWYNRPPILFEQESVRGDTPPSRASGREVTPTTETSVGECSESALAYVIHADITPKVNENMSGTLRSQGGGGPPIVATKGIYVCHGSQSPINNADELANCLGTNNGTENVLAYTIHADLTPKVSEDVRDTLRSQGGGGIVPPAVVYGFDTKQKQATAIEELSPTLVASGYKEPVGVLTQYVVRRITVTECERLQGFPDGYTDVPHNGKAAGKSARYKALGNSMAVPVMRWIGERISQSLSI